MFFNTLKLMIGLLITVVAFSQSSFTSSGSVSWGGTVRIQTRDVTAPATNTAKCAAYLEAAGLPPNTFVDTGDDYEQVGQGISCFRSSFENMTERDF